MAARYRKIDPRFWKDEKVRRMAPEEKLVAVYGFTAQSNRIGCFTFSPAMAAEDLGMKPETFAKRFDNVCLTLAWGWDATSQVLYLPTWWKYNQPENQNNMIGNLKDLEDVPHSPLVAAFCTNGEHLQNGLSETFTQTLAERYPKRLASQEQEQEQVTGAGSRKQEQEKPAPLSLPSVLDTAEFRSAWKDWIAYRKEASLVRWKPMTIKAALEELEQLGSVAAVAAIKRSIAKGWKGIFPENGKATTAKPPDTRKRIPLGDQA